MSLERNRQEGEQEALREELLRQARDLAGFCATYVDNAIHGRKATFHEKETYVFTREGREFEAVGNSESTKLELAGKRVTVERRFFNRDNQERVAYVLRPADDEGQTDYAARKGEAAADHRRLPDEFAVVLYMSPGVSRVEEVDARRTGLNEFGEYVTQADPGIVGYLLDAFKEKL